MTAWFVVLRVRCPGPLGSCSPVRLLGVLCCVCGVLGHSAPVHRCARWLCCVACAVFWATWLQLTSVPVPFFAVLVWCPGQRGSCSPVCPLGVLCCVCGVLGHLAPVPRCARWVCCVVCPVSWAPCPCPGRIGSCSPVCRLGGLCCVCGVLGHLAPVHRCARSVGCVACAVSCATWLLFTGVPAWFVVLRVRCPGPLGSRSPVRPLGVLCCVCGVLGHLAPVQRCARSVCCVVCAVSWVTWLPFTGVPVWCVVLRVRCPGPLGSCSPVCPLGGLCCVCAVLGHLAPVHRCAARWVVLRGRCSGPLGSCSPVCPFRPLPCLCGVLFTGAPARCVVLCVRCPGSLGSRSPVCLFGVLCCVCGVLGHLAPVQRCAPSVGCVACALSWATWLLFTGVLLGALCSVGGVLDHLAPVHRCAHAVCCVVRALSWATWIPFTGVPTRCVVLRVQCPRPLGSCSLLCPLGGLCCLCCVMGHLAPVHQCACSLDCVACAVSWATWLLCTGAPAQCLVLHVRCPWPLGSCSPVCPLGVLCCVCGVLGHLAPVDRCAPSGGCVVCAVSWATWLLFTGVTVGGLCCPCGVLGHLTPVHQ